MNPLADSRGITDRQRGALLGLAVGDALGTAVEFKPAGTFAPLTAYRGGGPFGPKPGEWTDDTSMALVLADTTVSPGWRTDADWCVVIETPDAASELRWRHRRWRMLVPRPCW
jgi:ADP-ribosylglycohydrolase